MIDWREWPCVLWTGATSGQMKYGSISLPGKKKTTAHRRAWEKAYGSIPPGMHVCHHCDTPRCYEVHHLFLGTRSDNMRDAVAKGRHRHATTGPRNPARGERNSLAKLTADSVRTIRYMLATGSNRAQAGRAFGVRTQTVEAIDRGRTWRHV